MLHSRVNHNVRKIVIVTLTRISGSPLVVWICYFLCTLSHTEKLMYLAQKCFNTALVEMKEADERGEWYVTLRFVVCQFLCLLLPSK